jgi:D-amino-acid dehydrogenase
MAHVVVIGAGVVGACCAIELLRDGHQVTILEPGPPGGAQAASFGNGAWISPASVVPMSLPGTWRKVPGYLLDRSGPLTIRWTALPRLMPWLVRFLWAGASLRRVEGTARLLSGLLHDAPARHTALASEAGVADLIRRTGLLYIYPDRAAFDTEALAWRLRRANGVVWTELDEHELRQREPSLSESYRFGVLVDQGAHCTDPGAYVAALVAHAQSLGADLVRDHATGFDIAAGRLRGVRTGSGMLACDHAVIASGIGSKALARAAGERISLESERGYHVVIANPAAAPRTPVMPSDGKMANTLTLGGLRAAGQVELASVSAKPDWRRADILLAHLRRAFPGLDAVVPERITSWMGHRPSTPDGRPIIRHSVTRGIVLAFGHGHVGLASGPATGRQVADLLATT